MPVATVEAAPRRWGDSTATGATAVTGGSATMLIAGLGGPAWSRDEAATAIVVARPITQVWATWSTDPALEPYYLLANAWALVSTHEIWLRLPSVIAAAVTSGLVVLIVARLLNPRAGVAAGALFALLPAVTRYGQEARPYALVMLACTAIVWLWLRDRSLPHRRRILVALGVVVLGLLHAYALVLLLGLLTVSLVQPQRDRRQEVTALIVVGGAAALALSAFLVLLVLRAKGDPSPDAITLQNVVVESVRLPVGVLRPWGAAFTGSVVLVIAAFGAVIGWRQGAGARTLVALGVSWLATWVTALIALQALTGAPGLVGRYWTPALPGLALCAAPLLDAVLRRSTVAALGLIALVAAIGLPTQLHLRRDDGHGGAGWFRLTQALTRPALEDLPLLAKGSTARPLLAHGLPLARLPLVRDPAASGRVLVESDSSPRALSRLGASRPVVVILANAEDQAVQPPTPDEFPGFARELAVYSRSVLLCSWFGEPLGVFALPGSAFDPGRTTALRDTLVDAADSHVRCTAPEGG